MANVSKQPGKTALSATAELMLGVFPSSYLNSLSMYLFTVGSDITRLMQVILYPSYFKLHVRWLRSLTRITYLSKLIVIPSLAAFLKLELFSVYQLL